MNYGSRQAIGLVAWYPALPMAMRAGNNWGNAVRPTFEFTNNGTTPVDYHQEHGRVFNFNGSSQYFTNSAAILTAPPLTMAAWIYPFSSAPSDQFIIDIHQSAAATFRNSIQLEISVGGSNLVRIRGNTGTASRVASSTTGCPVREWSHACGVSASQTSRAAYRNGGSKGTNAQDGTPGLTVNEMTIGREGGSADTNYFTGLISDIRIYNIALNDYDVYNLFDPDTRWQLYYPIGRITYTFAPPAAPSGGVPRLLTLGVG